MTGPGDQPVGGPEFDHHRSEIDLIPDGLSGLFEGNALVFAVFVKGEGVFLKAGVGFGVYKLDFGGVSAVRPQAFFEGRDIAHNDKIC